MDFNSSCILSSVCLEVCHITTFFCKTLTAYADFLQFVWRWTTPSVTINFFCKSLTATYLQTFFCVFGGVPPASLCNNFFCKSLKATYLQTFLGVWGCATAHNFFSSNKHEHECLVLCFFVSVWQSKLFAMLFFLGMKHTCCSKLYFGINSDFSLLIKPVPAKHLLSCWGWRV